MSRGDRDNAMDSMRANLRDTISALNSASKDIEDQQRTVFPVMDMIKIVAENPRRLDAETQTDVQLGCAYPHIVNSVDTRSLD